MNVIACLFPQVVLLLGFHWENFIKELLLHGIKRNEHGFTGRYVGVQVKEHLKIPKFSYRKLGFLSRQDLLG